eukprot:TRINITY_DN9080_c0_g1_i1.p1 TRINITY_DN9080_c0_g1~~TRINITY_DN9080_c0_g1_i1.p1  ORF type:complete len:226 (-),score=30.41 TRINITY_DN9080_c0_g1_i1:32-709(-)
MSILSRVTLKARSEMLRFWLKVEKDLFQLNNFHHGVAVRSSLESVAITRLGHAISAIGRKDLRPDEGYPMTLLWGSRRMNEFIAQATGTERPTGAPAFIPHFGNVMSDCTFIGENRVVDRGGCVKWRVLTMMQDTTDTVFGLKQYLHRYPPLSSVGLPEDYLYEDAYLHALLFTAPPFANMDNVEPLYDVSLALEPRGMSKAAAREREATLLKRRREKERWWVAA